MISVDSGRLSRATPVTIRKAIHALRDEGLVRTTPGWGTYVVKPEERDK